MSRAALPVTLLLLAVSAATASTASDSGCLSCHQEQARGLAEFHTVPCARCHTGDPAAVSLPAAHQGLIAFPGNLSNAPRSCGACHADRVASVSKNLMNTGTGMVNVTRRVFDEPPGGGIDSLGDSPADTLLRKLCVGCHLGQDKTAHGANNLRKGGGCLACHLETRPAKGHPRLTAQVSDERCFGCHSRSGRIALNYAGLAEVDQDALAHADTTNLGRLPDKRLVERKAADIHHRAGMSCIDCHTALALMGSSDGVSHAEEAVDIVCNDCHQPRAAVGTPSKDLAPTDTAAPTTPAVLSTRKHGTPLAQIETREGGLYLRRKVNGGVIRIPPARRESHPLATEHARLSCAACHSQWAPQCYGCHIRYEPQGQQWDHLQQRLTPGRWRETRWSTSSGPPTLGINDKGRIVPMIPGMILTMDHPDWDEPRFKRLFAPISPHTIGRSRSCASCHCSSHTLGLGAGTWRWQGDQLVLEPAGRILLDGLPEDAWTGPNEASTRGGSTREGARPFSAAEIRRIFRAGVQCGTDAG